MRIEHTLPPDLLSRRPVRVLVVGAGGTGSATVMGLPYLHQAMRVWGHSHGLEVCIMDADAVSETNCVRQPFSASDVGQNKATVLINRTTCFGERTGPRTQPRSTEVHDGCRMTVHPIWSSAASTVARAER